MQKPTCENKIFISWALRFSPTSADSKEFFWLKNKNSSEPVEVSVNLRGQDESNGSLKYFKWFPINCLTMMYNVVVIT